MIFKNILTSKLDNSVNFIGEGKPGLIEARLVNRPGKLIVYLSSQTGCDQACRMCHLTATGQTLLRNVTLDELVDQAQVVANHVLLAEQRADERGRYAEPFHPYNRIHFNFMARGEPLNNPTVYRDWDMVTEKLEDVFEPHGEYDYEFLISTIFPITFDAHDLEWLQRNTRSNAPTKIYWSAYSADEDFRKRWLPKAKPFDEGLALLKQWIDNGNEGRIHYCFIEGQNDSVDEVKRVAEKVGRAITVPSFNIVRFNSPSERWKEPAEDVIQRNVDIIRDTIGQCNIKIVPRVGLDVHASCGTFVTGDA